MDLRLLNSPRMLLTMVMQTVVNMMIPVILMKFSILRLRPILDVVILGADRMPKCYKFVNIHGWSEK